MEVALDSSAKAGDGKASETPLPAPRKRRAWPIVAVAVVATVALGAGFLKFGDLIVSSAHSGLEPVTKEKTRTGTGAFVPTTSQWATLSVETVTPHTFRRVVTTDGRIAIDEDNTTPVYSPYQGRVMSLRVKAGDRIEVGQPLFTIAATDMVQAQNDFVSAVAALNKANSAFHLAEINFNRARNLYEMKAGSQRDFQAAEDTRTSTRSDKSAAEAALEAARNRLRLLGKTDDEITVFQREGRISPETIIPAPLSGTVVQRKVGPGQLVGGASSDPVYVIGDLSSVWVVANVKESDVPGIRVGQPVELRLLALPGEVFKTKLSYLSASVDPATRRLMVRAELPNKAGLLRPEMFAIADIITNGDESGPSIPRSALIYEGEAAHVWLVGQDKSITKRPVKVGAATVDRVQVLQGLENGDKIISKGSLFIDRVATSSE